jgi:hypothetical protein
MVTLMGTRRAPPPPPPVILPPPPPPPSIDNQDTELAAYEVMRRNAKKVGRSGTRLATGQQAAVLMNPSNKLLGQ